VPSKRLDMPGTAAESAPLTWFDSSFGFEEKKYEETRSMFAVDGELLISKANDKKFHLGSFDVISLEDLQKRSDSASLDAPDSYMMAGDLTFENIVADTYYELYEDARNEGSVFQVSSLFNCLETVLNIGARPEDGVSSYGGVPFQGPASACACPAATVFRNYLVNGVGQAEEKEGKGQVDCLSEVSDLVQNAKEGYWTMKQGYCTPLKTGSILKLSRLISGDKELAEKVVQKVQVGVHWDTEVWTGTHRVCQVFCSALPVAYFKSAATSSDWQGFGRAVLEAAFEATLMAAAVLAMQRGERVKVFLTTVGGGELGNRRNWIADAIEKALTAHRMQPLDIFLVHNADIPELYQNLQRGRNQQERVSRRTRRTATQHAASLSSTIGQSKARQSLQEAEIASSPCNSTLQKLSRMFAIYDANGDGVMSTREFEDMLSHANEDFFTLDIIRKLVKCADADDTGFIHYTEFLQFVFKEEGLTPMLLNAAARTDLQVNVKPQTTPQWQDAYILSAGS